MVHFAPYAALGAGVALLAFSGCSSRPAAPTQPTAPQTTIVVQPAPSQAAPTVDTSTVDVTQAPTPSPTTASPTGAAQPTEGPAPAEPFAVRAGALDDTRVRASLFPVVRTGRTVAVNLMLESVDPEQTFNLGTSMSDGTPEVASNQLQSVDGLRLVDSANKKAYLPATTGNGTCLCTPADGEVYNFQAVMWVSVVFAAPPAAVTAIDVQVPNFGTITDVPVQ